MMYQYQYDHWIQCAEATTSHVHTTRIHHLWIYIIGT